MTDNNIDDNVDKQLDTIKDDEPEVEDITGGHSIVKKEEPVVRPIEKQKRPRSEAQIKAFQRCREQRANKIAEKKKLKETEKKKPVKKKVEVAYIPDDEPKQKEQEIEDDGDDEETDSDDSIEVVVKKAKPKPKPKAKPPPKKKKKVVYITDSDSSEEDEIKSPVKKKSQPTEELDFRSKMRLRGF